MLEEKDTYSIQELFDAMDISIKRLGETMGVSEVTLARIRDGKPTYRRTANKLLNVFSEMYKRPLYLSKVTGINIAVSGKKKASIQKEAKSNTLLEDDSAA
jgi:predicted transcriptional regulator